MKYLILLITSLFFLSAYSSHKKTPSASKEEKDRFHYLINKGSPLTAEEREERKKLSKLVNQEYSSLTEHFHEYISLEYRVFEIDKEDPVDQYNAFFRLKRDIDMHIPDCTKERLEKKQCPKAPYHAIYWAKKYFETGHCVSFSSFLLAGFLERYVIPKTDMAKSKEFFHLLFYISAYFEYEIYKYKLPNILKGKEAQEKDYLGHFLKIWGRRLKEGTKEEKQRTQESIKRIKYAYQKQKNSIRESLKRYHDRAMKAKKNLSEKDQITSDKMINDLTQKWSEKYGKDEIYECRELDNEHSFDSFQSRKKFLEKNYPHF